MITGKVMTAAFLLNGRPTTEKLVAAVMKIVQEMSKDEMATLRYYEEHGTFINS